MSDLANADPAVHTVRNTVLLSISQAIIGSQQAMIAAVGALVGVVLAPTPALATAPTTAMVLGLALNASLATYVIFRFGRRSAFMFGATLSVLGGLIAATAIIYASFFLFCAGLLVCGAAASFGQQYRFAAADSVAAEFKPKAISWVLAGGVAAGFVGPALSYLGRDWFAGAEYAGSFVAVSGLALIGIAVLSQTMLGAPQAKEKAKEKRPFGELIRSAEIFVPIISGMASYGLMTFVMVAAPLAMVYVCGHSKVEATTAIQWHVVAMYAPSFFTGSVINKLGARLTTAIGLFLILVSAVISLNGISVWHFYVALVLLGSGWNFGFIGSTTLLAAGYRPADAPRVQALNEQLVFGTMAIASISSGVLLQTIGWQSINVLALPIATIAIIMLGYGDWRQKRLRTA